MSDIDPSNTDNSRGFGLSPTLTSQSRVESQLEGPDEYPEQRDADEIHIRSRASLPMHLLEERESEAQPEVEVTEDILNSRFYTKEYLQRKKEYLLLFRAHYMCAKDKINSDYSRSDGDPDKSVESEVTFLQRVDRIVKREEQDLLLVETFVRGIVNKDQAFLTCMGRYFDGISECPIWEYETYGPLLLSSSDSQFTGQLERYYYGPDTDINTTMIGAELRRVANIANIDMMDHFSLVRYVPQPDEDSDVDSNLSFKDSDSSIGAFGNGDERGKARYESPWEKSDLPNVYLKSHRAACGCCLENFEEPRKTFLLDSASGNFTSGVEAEGPDGDSVAQQKQQPEPLIQLSCNHVFHKSCLFQLLLRSQECPMCRREISLPHIPPKQPDGNQLGDAPAQPILGPVEDTLSQLSGIPNRPTDAPIQQTPEHPRNNLIQPDDTPDQLAVALIQPIDILEQLSDGPISVNSDQLLPTFIQPSDTSILPTSDQVVDQPDDGLITLVANQPENISTPINDSPVQLEELVYPDNLLNQLSIVPIPPTPDQHISKVPRRSRRGGWSNAPRWLKRQVLNGRAYLLGRK